MLRNKIDKIRLLFRKDRESYSCFYRILGFYPRNIRLYEQALLHKSTAVRSEKGRPLNNERLEFLGDAILDAIVGDIVYQHFEGKREGFLTNTRSKIVQRETLNKLAVEIGLDKLIKYSTRSSSHNSYMYGNAFDTSSVQFILTADMNAANSSWKEESSNLISIWINFHARRSTSSQN